MSLAYRKPNGNMTWLAVEPARCSQTTGLHNRTDFSATCYPFGESDRSPYIGQETDINRKGVAIKYGLYVLADASDELLEYYHDVRALKDNAKQQWLKDNLHESLVLLCRDIRSRVEHHFQRPGSCYGLHVARIALSVPAQWTLKFWDVYRRIVAEVFPEVDPGQYYFATETECLGQYLMHQYRDLLQEGGPYEMILFMDFGGHNMVRTCTYNLSFHHRLSV